MKTMILTIYFSHKGETYFPDGIKNVDKGNTEIAAEYIHKAVGGDLFEIETVKPYSGEYRKCCAEAKSEADANARPEIKNLPDSISRYDTIFVCYPNWCGTTPMCILSFLDKYDLSGKKIVPLCTNEGSGMGNSERDLKNLYPTAIFAEGLSVRGHQARESEESIAEWAKKHVL